MPSLYSQDLTAKIRLFTSKSLLQPSIWQQHFDKANAGSRHCLFHNNATFFIDIIHYCVYLLMLEIILMLKQWFYIGVCFFPTGGKKKSELFSRILEQKEEGKKR